MEAARTSFRRVLALLNGLPADAEVWQQVPAGGRGRQFATPGEIHDFFNRL